MKQKTFFFAWSTTILALSLGVNECIVQDSVRVNFNCKTRSVSLDWQWWKNGERKRDSIPKWKTNEKTKIINEYFRLQSPNETRKKKNLM